MIANELPPCIPGGPFQDFLKSASLPELEEERIISTFSGSIDGEVITNCKILFPSNPEISKKGRGDTNVCYLRSLEDKRWLNTKNSGSQRIGKSASFPNGNSEE